MPLYGTLWGILGHRGILTCSILGFKVTPLYRTLWDILGRRRILSIQGTLLEIVCTKLYLRYSGKFWERLWQYWTFLLPPQHWSCFWWLSCGRHQRYYRIHPCTSCDFSLLKSCWFTPIVYNELCVIHVIYIPLNPGLFKAVGKSL